MTVESSSPRCLRPVHSVRFAVAALMVLLCLLLSGAAQSAHAPALPPAPGAAEALVSEVVARPFPRPTVQSLIPLAAETFYDYGAPVPLYPAPEGAWLDDAAFVGDSRTDGLFLFGGMKGGTRLSSKGLTVKTVRTTPVITLEGKRTTATEALAAETYGKIYIMLGVNELGWRNDARYFEAYETLLELTREAQPSAQIYLQTLIPVTTKKSDDDTAVTNDGIRRFNDFIARLALKHQVYLLDVYAAFADEAGNLPSEQSADGVHLNRPYYAQWASYLKTHVVPQ